MSSDFRFRNDGSRVPLRVRRMSVVGVVPLPYVKAKNKRQVNLGVATNCVKS